MKKEEKRREDEGVDNRAMCVLDIFVSSTHTPPPSPLLILTELRGSQTTKMSADWLAQDNRGGRGEGDEGSREGWWSGIISMTVC